MISKRKKCRSGMTLLEVMMALMILGLGMAGLLSATSKAMHTAKMSREYEKARHLIARLKIEEPLQLDELEESTDSGSFGGDYRNYSWEREITLMGKEEDEIYQIRSRVYWPSRRTRKFEEVTTLLHLPTALENGFISENASPRD